MYIQGFRFLLVFLSFNQGCISELPFNAVNEDGKPAAGLCPSVCFLHGTV